MDTRLGLRKRGGGKLLNMLRGIGGTLTNTRMSLCVRSMRKISNVHESVLSLNLLQLLIRITVDVVLKTVGESKSALVLVLGLGIVGVSVSSVGTVVGVIHGKLEVVDNRCEALKSNNVVSDKMSRLDVRKIRTWSMPCAIW